MMGKEEQQYWKLEIHYLGNLILYNYFRISYYLGILIFITQISYYLLFIS